MLRLMAPAGSQSHPLLLHCPLWLPLIFHLPVRLIGNRGLQADKAGDMKKAQSIDSGLESMAGVEPGAGSSSSSHNSSSRTRSRLITAEVGSALRSRVRTFTGSFDGLSSSRPSFDKLASLVDQVKYPGRRAPAAVAIQRVGACDVNSCFPPP